MSAIQWSLLWFYFFLILKILSCFPKYSLANIHYFTIIKSSLKSIIAPTNSLLAEAPVRSDSHTVAQGESFPRRHEASRGGNSASLPNLRRLGCDTSVKVCSHLSPARQPAPGTEFHPLLCLRSLPDFPEYSKYSINICWMHKWHVMGVK